MLSIARTFEMYKGGSMYDPENQEKLRLLLKNIEKLNDKIEAETNPRKRYEFKKMLFPWYETLLELATNDSEEYKRHYKFADTNEYDDFEYEGRHEEGLI